MSFFSNIRKMFSRKKKEAIKKNRETQEWLHKERTKIKNKLESGNLTVQRRELLEDQLRQINEWLTYLQQQLELHEAATEN